MAFCYFCEYLNQVKAGDRRRMQGDSIMRFDYHAVLYQRAWNTITGTAHAGTMTHKPKATGFDLNYCPECGRKLEDEDEK